MTLEQHDHDESVDIMPVGDYTNSIGSAGPVQSNMSIMNRPAIGLMPNYPKKQGKMFHIELG